MCLTMMAKYSVFSHHVDLYEILLDIFLKSLCCVRRGNSVVPLLAAWTSGLAGLDTMWFYIPSPHTTTFQLASVCLFSFYCVCLLHLRHNVVFHSVS